jgi:hypothetical protein
MKKLILSIAAVALLVTAGCKTANPNAGPALLRLGVSTTAGYSIMRYPQAVPGVRAGADVICAAAAGTNVSPVQIVAALDAYGVKSPEAVFILNAALGAYNIAYNGLSSTNAAQPYAQAVCDGLHDALMLSPTVALRNSVRLQQWPQVRFP